jgi:hypothetical protein
MFKKMNKIMKDNIIDENTYENFNSYDDKIYAQDLREEFKRKNGKMEKSILHKKAGRKSRDKINKKRNMIRNDKKL